MNRIAYVRLDAEDRVIDAGETDEAAFVALAPADAIRIPLGMWPALGSAFDRADALLPPDTE